MLQGRRVFGVSSDQAAVHPEIFVDVPESAMGEVTDPCAASGRDLLLDFQHGLAIPEGVHDVAIVFGSEEWHMPLAVVQGGWSRRVER